MRVFVLLFSYAWLFGVLLIGGAMMLFALGMFFSYPTRPPREALLFLVVPPFMVACFYLLVKFGRYLARNERDFLLDFLRDTVNAREVR